MPFDKGAFVDGLRPDTPSGWASPHGTPFRRLVDGHGRGPLDARALGRLEQLAAEMTRGPDVAEHGPIPSGHTYWGQLLSHDLTLAMPTPPGSDPAVRNARSGKLDLECVLGRGPRVDAHLYRRRGPPEIVLDERPDDEVVDVPRRADGTAVIADVRNDDNALVLQLHVALARAYNRLVTRRFAELGDRLAAYDRARRELTAVYQRVTLEDYLPRVLHASVRPELERLVARAAAPTAIPRRVTAASLPLEFALAAMRFGHAMVRDAYTLNDGLGRAFPMMPRRTTSAADGNLRGGKPLVARWGLDWSHLFDAVASSPRCQRARLLGPRLSPSLGDVLVAPGERHDLALLTLIGEWCHGVPGAAAVTRSLGLALPVHDGHDSLWWSVLEESRTLGRGATLGPTGSALVLAGFEEALAGEAWHVDAPASRRADARRGAEPATSLLGAQVTTVDHLVRFGTPGLVERPTGRRTRDVDGTHAD